MKRRIALALIAAVLGGMVTGCAADKTAATASMAAVNSKCACGDAVDGKTTRTFDGKTVGFCGPGCAAEFDKMTDAQKRADLAKAMNAKK